MGGVPVCHFISKSGSSNFPECLLTPNFPILYTGNYHANSKQVGEGEFVSNNWANLTD